MPEEDNIANDSAFQSFWHLDSGQANNNGMLLEEEKPIIPGVVVKAATLDALVDFLINSFLPIGGLKEENNNFPRVMLLMHQWFISSEELAQCLISKFWNKEDSFRCSPSCLHTLQWVTDCVVYQHRARVCQAFRYWIRMFPIHFDLNSTLTSIVQEFQKHLHKQGNGVLADLLDLSKLPSYDWARSMSVRNPPVKHSRKISLVFDHLEPDELANHITFLEHKVMRRITFTDFKAYAEHGTLQDNPRLERSISVFNGLSQWIQWMVLNHSLPQQRADVIVKFVKVAAKLRQQNNFNSLMSVIGGLSHSALARLTCTLAYVPAEIKKCMEDLSGLLSSASNFSNYRKSLAESQGFKIPILGVHMKDLISLHVALPDTVDNGLINFRKISQLSLIFQELWELQNSLPAVSVNADLINTLRLSLDATYSEDGLYELSLLREPRHPLSPHSSPNKPTVFSEWAAGTENVDSETLEKHLHSIVEVIFKNYDTDKDGYLSQEEFRAISFSVPSADAFPEIDTNKDGKISKAELKLYFTNSNAKPLRITFHHYFHETTYFKPTFCAHCTGLLWGLIKQGYKCKDCGINVHKHCRDVIVIECRKTSASRSNSFAASDGTKLKVRIQRPWRRQLKSSQSDNECGFPARTSTDSDLCQCDNGLVPVDISEIGKRTSQPSETMVKSKSVSTSLSALSSYQCCCQQALHMPQLHKATVDANLSTDQCTVVRKMSPMSTKQCIS